MGQGWQQGTSPPRQKAALEAARAEATGDEAETTHGHTSRPHRQQAVMGDEAMQGEAELEPRAAGQQEVETGLLASVRDQLRCGKSQDVAARHQGHGVA
jgi:hypothetical protein